MAVDKPYFTTTSISQNYDSVIDMLSQAPDLNTQIDPPRPPNKLYGYYNAVTDGIQLYVTNSNGTSYIRVR